MIFHDVAQLMKMRICAKMILNLLKTEYVLRGKLFLLQYTIISFHCYNKSDDEDEINELNIKNSKKDDPLKMISSIFEN